MLTLNAHFVRRASGASDERVLTANEVCASAVSRVLIRGHTLLACSIAKIARRVRTVLVRLAVLRVGRTAAVRQECEPGQDEMPRPDLLGVQKHSQRLCSSVACGNSNHGADKPRCGTAMSNNDATHATAADNAASVLQPFAAQKSHTPMPCVRLPSRATSCAQASRSRLGLVRDDVGRSWLSIPRARLG